MVYVDRLLNSTSCYTILQMCAVWGLCLPLEKKAHFLQGRQKDGKTNRRWRKQWKSESKNERGKLYSTAKNQNPVLLSDKEVMPVARYGWIQLVPISSYTKSWVDDCMKSTTWWWLVTNVNKRWWCNPLEGFVVKLLTPSLMDSLFWDSRQRESRGLRWYG